MGGEVSQGVVDSAAVFLFSLFRSDPLLSRAHADEMRRTLGPYPATAASKACGVVRRVLSYLPKDVESGGRSQRGHGPELMKKEFGHNITFQFEDSASQHSLQTEEVKPKRGGSKDLPPRSLDPATHEDGDGYDSLSDSEGSRPNLVASALLNGMASFPASVKAAEVRASPSSDSSEVPYSGAWLKNKCQDCIQRGMAGMTWQDLYSAIFEVLSSTGNNTAIQNDVSWARGTSHQLL